MRQRSQKRRADYPRLEYAPRPIAEVMTEKRTARFLRKIDKAGPDLCHPWRGSRHKAGYGLFQGSTGYQGYSLLAHRVAFWLHHGREPVGLVLHSCDNPPCCNPRHLREGSHADNAQDAVVRGRTARTTGPRGPQKPAKAAEAWRLRYEAGLPINEIAQRIGAHRSSVMRWTAA